MFRGGGFQGVSLALKLTEWRRVLILRAGVFGSQLRGAQPQGAHYFMASRLIMVVVLLRSDVEHSSARTGCVARVDSRTLVGLLLWPVSGCTLRVRIAHGLYR